jgi:hypothetical protein
VSSHNSRLHHIGLSRRRRGTKVTVLIDDRDIRVLDRDTGQLIRKLVLDPPATTNHGASNAEIHPKTGSSFTIAQNVWSPNGPRVSSRRDLTKYS